MSENTNIDRSRRSFLRDAATALPAVAVATALPAVTAQAESSAEPGGGKSKGYRLTQHVSDYYKSATA